MDEKLKITWVRLLLFGSVGVSQQQVFDLQIIDALKLTDIFHILAASQLIAAQLGVQFAIPQIDAEQFKTLYNLMNKVSPEGEKKG